jgi:hypothetical protein
MDISKIMDAVSASGGAKECVLNAIAAAKDEGRSVTADELIALFTTDPEVTLKIKGIIADVASGKYADFAAAGTGDQDRIAAITKIIAAQMKPFAAN